MEMNQQTQVSYSFLTPEVTVKKKRGRPRKDPTLKPAKTAYVPRKTGPPLNYAEKAPVPPGFEEVNGSRPQPVDPINDNNMDSMVGQVVTGVIEAVFDAGFLLSVRVGDSNTCLRGVVFKSGHYVPVNAENDLAPGLEMIRRNEVPFPVGNQTYKHRHRGRKQSESQHLDVCQSNGSPASNEVARARARQLAIVPAQAPTPNLLEGRGTLVPVVLRPVNLSNEAMPPVEVRPIASQPAHLSASRVKHCNPSQAVPEASLKGSESQPFEELVSAAKKLKRDPHSGHRAHPSQEGQDLSKPLCIEPLQAIHSGLPDRSAPMSHPFPERSTGKMTELLLAVQENLMERQKSESQHQEFRNPEN